MTLSIETFDGEASFNSCSGRCGGGCQNSGSHRCASGTEITDRPEISASDIVAGIQSVEVAAPAEAAPAVTLN